MKKSILVAALVSSMSFGASAALCSVNETVSASAFSVNSSTTTQASSFSALDAGIQSKKVKKKGAPSVSVSEYGALVLTMESCSVEMGTSVKVRAQKRENMQTVEDYTWYVHTSEVLCDPNIDVSKGVTLTGDDAELTMQARMGREANYTLNAVTPSGETLALFADKSSAAY
jgi:hypothetical protein